MTKYSYTSAKTKNRPSFHSPIPEDMFWLLIDISPIHSEKVILALRDHLVMGESRKIVCERYKVNNGYFCVSLNRLYRIDKLVSLLVPYYVDIVSQIEIE